MPDRASSGNGGSPPAATPRDLKLNPLLRDKPALANPRHKPNQSIRLSLFAADVLLVLLAGFLLFGGATPPRPAEIGAAVLAIIAAGWLGCLAMTLRDKKTPAPSAARPEKTVRPKLTRTLFQ